MALKATSLALGLSTLMATLPVSAANVVASIKPVELLVKAVGGDTTNVTTLVPPGASPHNYSMKPSQRRALENADAVFWIGPDMETFLGRLLGSEEFEGRVVALADHEDEERLEPERDDHGHEPHGHTHGGGEDPHIWVDPQLALEMAKEIHARLGSLDGANRQQLDTNLAQFEQALHETEEAISQQLTALGDVSLFAYHSAFERFAEHYKLNLEGVLTLNPELSPGARHIADVQDKLREANQPCLLTEPQFDRQWWRSITQGLDVTFSTWDPLAMDIESNADGYLKFQQSIADAVLRCSPKHTEQ
ncbi:zinc ABC transporter substrate-binding protein [Marinobacter nauticus]